MSWQVSQILDRPPITMLSRIEGNQEKMEIFLALEISKLKESINVDARLNLQDHQIPEVAQQILELYRLETLEDFVLCFKRAAIGQYGSIFRLDGPTIHEWIRKYLDEKYQFVEAAVKEEQINTDKSNDVNYEEFKKRAAEFVQPKKQNNAAENEYQKRRLENPYAYYKVKNVEVYATSQEHAEELVRKMIELGELKEVPNETPR